MLIKQLKGKDVWSSNSKEKSHYKKGMLSWNSIIRRLFKPSARKVLEAIFREPVFTKEELESMKYDKSKGIPDLDERLFEIADKLEPRYSVSQSVKIAKRLVDIYRSDLLGYRPEICTAILLRLFK